MFSESHYLSSDNLQVTLRKNMTMQTMKSHLTFKKSFTINVVLLFLIASYIACSLSPLLESGYYSDDMVSSLTRGKLEYEKISFSDNVVNELTFGIKSLGRLQPFGALVGSTVMYFGYNVKLYKSIVLLLVIINVFLFGYFIHTISKDKNLAMFFMLLIPLFFQFKYYHDPILSFGGGLQVILGFFMISSIFLQKYLEQGDYGTLIISLLFYNICLYYYEVSIPLGLLFFIMIYCNATNLRSFIRKSLPFGGSILLAVIANLVVRYFFKDPAVSAYGGTSINLSLIAFMKTMYYQIVASVPLIYFIKDPTHIFRGINYFHILKQTGMQDIVVILTLFPLSYYLVKKINIEVINVAPFLLFGLILLVVPAAVISLTAKYQQEFSGGFWGAGIAYIPVYFQYYGAALIFIGMVLFVIRTARLKVNSGTAIILAILLSAVAITNVTGNKITVEKSNIDMYYGRLTLEHALSNNLLKNVPDSSTILVQYEYNYNPYSQSPTWLKNWVYAYDWSNRYLFYFYAKKRLNIIHNIGEITSIKSMIEDLRIPDMIEDMKDDAVYLLTVNSFREYENDFQEKEGYVTLDKIDGIILNRQEVNKSHINTRPVERYYPTTYFTYTINKSINFKDHFKLSDGWSYAEATRRRWSEGKQSNVIFRLEDVPRDEQQLSLVIDAASNGRQKVDISINGEEIGSVNFGGPPEINKISFTSKLLREKEMNTIILKMPDAQPPGNGDPRVLGIYLSKLMITDHI